MHANATPLVSGRLSPAQRTATRELAHQRARRLPVRAAWSTAELARDWSVDDPYERWPAAIAVSNATGLRPVLIHHVRGTEAVVILPGSPVRSATVPIADLVPLAYMHEAPRQFCVAVLARAAEATLDHFAAEWDAAIFASVVDGHLLDPVEMP